MTKEFFIGPLYVQMTVKKYVVFYFYSCTPRERISALGIATRCRCFMLLWLRFVLFTVFTRCDIFFFCTPCVFFSARAASSHAIPAIMDHWASSFHSTQETQRTQMTRGTQRPERKDRSECDVYSCVAFVALRALRWMVTIGFLHFDINGAIQICVCV